MNIVKMATPQSRVNATPIKTPNYFCRKRKTESQISMELQGIPNSQTILKKKKKKKNKLENSQFSNLLQNFLALTSVAPWVGCRPTKRKVASSIRSGHMPGSQVQSPVGVCVRGNPSRFLSHTDVPPPLLLPPLPLNQKIKNFKTFV